MKNSLILLLIILLEISAAGTFSTDDYKYALWMSTRFYGAQRCGEGPNWLTMDHGAGNCHLKDADGDYDLSGGWHDCGDHVKFGQTQFYSAYSLLKAYDAFPLGFYDNYSYDYHGYHNANNFSYGNGAPNGIPDVLDEVRYAIEYFIKVVRDETDFYYQVGDGNADHKNWVTSVYQSTLGVDAGGDPRPFVKGTGSDAKAMAAQCSAALALFSIEYKKFDAQLSAKALEKAKVAYRYAVKATTTTSSGFYGANPSATDDMTAAALELYRATGDEQYKSMAETNLNPPYWVLCYEHIEEYSFFTQQEAGLLNTEVKYKGWIDDYIVSKTNTQGVCTVGDDWGRLRYTAGATFGTTLYATLAKTDQYDSFIFRQIDHILGDNPDNMSFLTGFNRGNLHSVVHPHHRNVYLNDDNVADKNSLVIPERNSDFGYLIGGTRSSGYVDEVDAYQGSEGGIDYNAGLVGALAYLVAKMAPVDTSAVSIVKNSVSQVNKFKVTINNEDNLQVSFNRGSSSGKVSLFNLSGKQLISQDINPVNTNTVINLSNFPEGVYLYQISEIGNSEKISGRVMLK